MRKYRLDEGDYSAEARDIRASVMFDIKKFDWANEEDYYYMIGAELASRDLPFIPDYFLPDDKADESDKEYQDLKMGYEDNGGIINENLNENKLTDLFKNKKQFSKHTKDYNYTKSLVKEILNATDNNAGKLLTAINQNMNGEDFCDFLENVCDALDIYYNFDEFGK